MKRFFLLMLLLLGGFPRSALAQNICKVRIYFLNGIDTNYSSAQDMPALMRANFQTLAQKHNISASYGFAYNPTDGKLLDLYESAQQKMLEDSAHIDPVMFQTGVLNAARNTSKERLEERARLRAEMILKSIESHRPEVVNVYVPGLEKDLSEGYKIIILSHSQGNLYANEILKVLQSKKNPHLGNFRILGLATPSDNIGGMKPPQANYITNDWDIIQMVPNHLGANLPLALSGGVAPSPNDLGVTFETTSWLDLLSILPGWGATPLSLKTQKYIVATGVAAHTVDTYFSPKFNVLREIQSRIERSYQEFSLVCNPKKTCVAQCILNERDCRDGKPRLCQNNVDNCPVWVSQAACPSGQSCSAGVCGQTPPIQPGEVLIPAGTFTMGSPTNELGRSQDETQYQVTLTRSFFMQKYEVTQSEFQARMGYNPSDFSSCGGNCPVEQVNWHEAAAYCNAASRAAGLAECFTCTGSGTSVTCSVAAAYTGANYYNCRGYRLPTEAEWEYAYRAGTSTAFYNGGITNTQCSPLDANADAIAWYCGNAQSKTHPVGGKQPNAWGLYDMAGNVWEWCYDWYDDYSAQAATDPVGAATGTYRVLRGGSWDYGALNVRAARRRLNSPTNRHGGIGFRVVRSSP